MPNERALEVSVREALTDDARAIAELHAAVWNETYREVAPATAIEKLDAAFRLNSWLEVLGKQDVERTTIVAENSGDLAGFISFGSTNNPVYEGRAEIKHLYLANALRGKGIGRKLMALAFQQLHLAGYHGAGLAVVQENTAARSFYASLGGVEVTEFDDPGPLWKSKNMLVAWALPARSF